MSDIIRKETAHAINGVQGRLFTLHRPPAPWKAGTFANQKWLSESRAISGYSKAAQITVEVRFDDGCKNGHNSFSITAHVESPASRRHNDWEAGGCLHEDIARVFPELAHLIKWHLCSTDGPMHYVANTVYLASDRDCRGFAKGDACAWDEVVYFGTSPVRHKIKSSFSKFIQERMHSGDFIVVALAHESRPGETYKYAPKYTFNGYGTRWHECPFDDIETANSWAAALNDSRIGARFHRMATQFSEGKARDFAAARNSAVWPDATDEQLSLPKDELTALLLARLPDLLAAMRGDIETAGFMWDCPTENRKA